MMPKLREQVTSNTNSLSPTVESHCSVVEVNCILTADINTNKIQPQCDHSVTTTHLQHEWSLTTVFM